MKMSNLFVGLAEYSAISMEGVKMPETDIQTL
jgi:hypothetical protein